MINLYSSTGTSGRPFSHITKLAFWREKFSVCKNSVKTVSRQFFAFLIFLEFWNTRWLYRISNKMATEAPVKQYFTGIIKQVSGILLLIKLSVWIFWTNLPVSTSMKDLLFQRFCGIQDRNIKNNLLHRTSFKSCFFTSGSNVAKQF